MMKVANGIRKHRARGVPCYIRLPPGVALSDEYPVNIGPQTQEGTGDEASRDDHTHYLPHDNTVGFVDGSLAVSIHDVVEASF